MTLATTLDLLTAARAAGGAVAALNVVSLEHAEAIVAGAERAGAVVILQVSENTVAYHGGRIEPIGRACAALAETAGVPVALHLDHATTRGLAERAVAVGFSSVMIDTSELPIDEHTRLTAEHAAWAHSADRGAALEAALGVVGGKDGLTTTVDGLTDPDAARAFVAATGVDALAVAVGTSHHMATRTASIDLDLIARLRAAVDVPLVLHGSSGVPDDDLVEAVRRGITKVNLATQLNAAFTGVLRDTLAAAHDALDPRPALAAAREAVAAVVADRLHLLAGAGLS